MPGLLRTFSWRWVLPLFLMSLFIGCGSPQHRYRILSFFFDGVPNPDAPKDTPGRSASSSKQTYVHQPYAQKNCNACHENTSDIFARAQVKPGVCRDCHGTVLVEYPQMHGPVAGGMCLMCHSPHLSPQKHLLSRPSPKLCVQCHETGTLSSKAPEHQDAAADCLTCHSGHGGTNRHFLFAKTTAAAATQPAPEGKVWQ